MSYTRAQAEDLIFRLERSLQRHADATAGVRRKAAETEVLKELGSARDLLSTAARGDRKLLDEVFGGSCEYFWRYQNALDRVQLSEEHAKDLRLGDLRAGLEIVKAVLQDVGSFKIWLLEITAPTKLVYEPLAWPAQEVRMEPILEGCNRATVRFMATPSLPSGLKLDRSSGEITGRVEDPEDDVWGQMYTVIASNAAGMTSTELNFSGKTLPPKILTYDGLQGESVKCEVGQKLCWLPKINGGACSWSIEPSLPTGLWIDEQSGCIFGSPSAAKSGQYTVTASNSSGSDRFAFELDVRASADRDCLSCGGQSCGLCSKTEPEKEPPEELLQKATTVCRLEWRKERRAEHSGWTSHSFLHALLEDGCTMRIQRFEGSDVFVTWHSAGLGGEEAVGDIYKNRVAPPIGP
mmetsp:Transcript_15351/g.36329  ORF Transcript_15351/g.36329 Transcript_15351/m.36329 type:complete len:408 (-) Transcript_15351:13-1236(-)